MGPGDLLGSPEQAGLLVASGGGPGHAHRGGGPVSPARRRCHSDRDRAPRLGAPGRRRGRVARPEPGWLDHIVAAFRGRTSERRRVMSAGTKEDPWVLKTPPGTSEYTMYRDEQADPPALVCQVGSTTLKYRLRAIEDLHAWLTGQGDWVPLGAADEKKAAADGTVEAWGRSAENPVGGWYG